MQQWLISLKLLLVSWMVLASRLILMMSLLASKILKLFGATFKTQLKILDKKRFRL